MINIQDIYEFLDKIAPFNTALEFDNCGLLVGSFDKKVNKVMLTLDITKSVVEEAHNIGARLIISHHPVIFKPISKLDFSSAVHFLSKFEISAICAHTNLDAAPKGVNFCLAEKLSLLNLEPLAYEENQPLGLIGKLEQEMDSKEFAIYVKSKLECKGLRYTAIDKKIKKVAVCSGSGGEFVSEAVRKKANAFVTGEIKHSQILHANEEGLMIVDAGHYKTENVVILPLKTELEKQFKDIEFFVTETLTDKIEYL